MAYQQRKPMTMGMVYYLAALLVFYMNHGTSLAVSKISLNRSDTFSLTIRMPNVVSHQPDSLVCTAAKLGPEETHILKFTPHATKTTAHHMVVFGCSEPASYNQSWNCRKETKSDSGICGTDSEKIMFAWAMDAPEKSLPQGIGMRISGNTGINYLVVQIHYAAKFLPGVTDSSGITLSMTHTRPEQQVGYIILGNWGQFPPKTSVVRVDSACVFRQNYTVYPIAFRTHSHNLGVVTTGYRIRNGVWKMIGKMSPQLPQTFYPVKDLGMDIRNGDILASRCIMNSMSRTTDVIFGATNFDEMCNFYIMYSTYYQETLKNIICFDDYQSNTWLNHFKTQEIPADSESVDGFPEAEKVKKMFIWA